ncbi:MAG TPA: response regulator [Pedobacter sp.]|nr:response regulator [Pedobacter sp.]
METIVIQETDPSVLEVLTLALTDAGFTVHALDHLNASFLEVIDQQRPHVVMLDFRLSGQQAAEVCFQIKSRYPHLPVIALSCNYNINQDYSRHGFDDYVRKPFDLDVLLKVLRSHIPDTAERPKD